MLDTLGDLLGPIFDAIGAFLSSPIVQFVLQAALFYILILWLAAAWWIFRDASQRTRNIVAPYLAAAPVILATPLGFIFVLVIWRIIRPTETHAAAAERELATDALKAEAANVLYCATCGRRVDADWIICPTCRSRLARVCPACKRLVGLDWSLCAWCGRDFEAPRAKLTRAPTPALEAGETGDDELPEAPAPAAIAPGVISAADKASASDSPAPTSSPRDIPDALR